MGASAVEVTGLFETRALLKQMEPDLLKRLDVRLTAIATDLKLDAQQDFEKTGATGSAFRVQTRNNLRGFTKSVRTMPGRNVPGEKWSRQPGLLAAIFEFANAVRAARPENVQRTRSMLATLNERYGPPGRFLWQSWDERKVPALASIDAEIRSLEAEYTERLR